MMNSSKMESEMCAMMREEGILNEFYKQVKMENL